MIAMLDVSFVYLRWGWNKLSSVSQSWKWDSVATMCPSPFPILTFPSIHTEISVGRSVQQVWFNLEPGLTSCFFFYNVHGLQTFSMCQQLLNLHYTVSRGILQARWVSMSSRICSPLWTAGSRTLWCLTRTGAGPLNLMRWIRQSALWVRVWTV